MLIILAVVGLGVAANFTFNRKKEKPEIEVEKAEKRTILSSVSESGTVQPQIEVKVAPDVSGEVVELRFREGQLVKKDDLLVTIRPDNYRSAMEQSQASLNAAEANYLQAKSGESQSRVKYLQDSANFKRNDDLYKQKVISQSEWENFRLQQEVSRSQLDASKQQVQAAYYQTKSSKASLEQAKQNLDRTNIYASMDGIITLQAVELGERVVGTMQMTGTEMLRIADLSKMEVIVNINENDIISLRVGDSTMVEVDAFRDKKFKGTVSKIAYSAQQASSGTTDQITNFEVKIEIDPLSYQNDAQLMRGINPNQSPFRPGMSARVQIFTERKENVLTVPIGAVMMRKREIATGGIKPTEVVYVLENGKAKEVMVKSGISDDEFIEITEGLNEGDVIITGPYLSLVKTIKDGTEVEIKIEKPGDTKKEKIKGKQEQSLKEKEKPKEGEGEEEE